MTRYLVLTLNDHLGSSCMIHPLDYCVPLICYSTSISSSSNILVNQPVLLIAGQQKLTMHRVIKQTYN